ncbi:MAG: hypothetical protein KJO31_03790 [Gammaproteobacteria bacterium]|nr:hypothetical protein [Gammaproteobacteria bacterium]
MDKLTVLANIAEIIGVVIVIGGLFFAILQMRQIRQQRRELAAIELFRFFGNPSFSDAYLLVLKLPDDMSADEIRASEDIEHAAMFISTTMENIGVMTHERIVPYLIVDSLMGINTTVLWNKLKNWTYALRQELGQEETFEWFEWLADKLEEQQPSNYTPAYIAYRDWRPARPHQES